MTFMGKGMKRKEKEPRYNNTDYGSIPDKHQTYEQNRQTFRSYFY